MMFTLNSFDNSQMMSDKKQASAKSNEIKYL